MCTTHTVLPLPISSGQGGQYFRNTLYVPASASLTLLKWLVYLNRCVINVTQKGKGRIPLFKEYPLIKLYMIEAILAFDSPQEFSIPS